MHDSLRRLPTVGSVLNTSHIDQSLLETRAWNLQGPMKFRKTISKKFVFQFLSIKTSLALFFVSHVSMKFE